MVNKLQINDHIYYYASEDSLRLAVRFLGTTDTDAIRRAQFADVVIYNGQLIKCRYTLQELFDNYYED